MPEPRLIHMGGEIYIGYEGGAKDAAGPMATNLGNMDLKTNKEKKRKAKHWNDSKQSGRSVAEEDWGWRHGQSIRR